MHCDHIKGDCTAEKILAIFHFPLCKVLWAVSSLLIQLLQKISHAKQQDNLVSPNSSDNSLHYNQLVVVQKHVSFKLRIFVQNKHSTVSMWMTSVHLIK